MGSNQSKTRADPNIAPMGTKRTRRTIPDLQFRVLVLGRANTGKTTILQRVCNTTESPTIYRMGEDGEKEEVRGPHFLCESDLTVDQFKLEPSMGVSDNHTSLRLPIDIVPARRAHHRRRTCVLQSYGLRFSRLSRNRVGWHRGTRDFERVHSSQMWRKKITRQIACNMVCALAFMFATTNGNGFRYCVPMDGHRPGLDLKFHKDICPDQNGVSL